MTSSSSAQETRIPALRGMTLEDMQAWFAAMAERGLLFHPDDDPATVVNSASTAPVFNENECRSLRMIMDVLFRNFPEHIHDAALKAANVIDAVAAVESANGHRTAVPTAELRATGAPYALWLATCGNPDMGQNPYGPHWGSQPDQFLFLPSLEAAGPAARAFIEDNGLGGGNWHGGHVFDVSGRLVGRVSYNGRYWPEAEKAKYEDAVAAAPAAAGDGATRVRDAGGVTTAVVVLEVMASVDVGDVVELDAMALPWNDTIQARIEQLSDACRSFGLESATTAVVEMKLIAGLRDGDIEDRILNARGGDEPLVLSADEWAGEGDARTEVADFVDSPQLIVSSTQWRVACREIESGLILVSPWVPHDFDPVAVLAAEVSPDVDDPHQTSGGMRTAAPKL